MHRSCSHIVQGSTVTSFLYFILASCKYRVVIFSITNSKELEGEVITMVFNLCSTKSPEGYDSDNGQGNDRGALHSKISRLGVGRVYFEVF